MNSVRNKIYFNRYCSTCGYRYPNVEAETKYDDECIHPELLNRYLRTINRLENKLLAVVAVDCKKILELCEGKYYTYRKPI